MPNPGGGGGSLPAWSPTYDQVAQYVPWLTVNIKVPGAQEYLNTFASNTSPSDTVADTHIADAVTIIGSKVVTMPTALYSLAQVVAAKYAAATLAVAYARTDEDRQRADALWLAAVAASADLATAADQAGESATSPAPVMYAPDPVPWGDSLLIDSAYPSYGYTSIWPE